MAKGAIAIGLAAASLAPVQLLYHRMRPTAPPHLPRLFHRAVLHGLGVRVVMHGQPARRQGVLFVANHLSWLDIPVLGSRLLGHFVAKSEVGAMGPVGKFADLQRTIYIDRERRHRAGEQRNAIAERLATGANVILFPEGTTGAGVELLPFNSALFAALDGLPDASVQPVSLAYTRIHGLPVTRRRLSEVVWLGDTAMGEHALDVLRLGRVQAEIICHETVRAADFPDRKALARYCQAQVAEGYARLMRGH